MPTIHVNMFEGRSPEVKKAFLEAITVATCQTLGTAPESVDILITEFKRENWATGGKLWSEKQ